MLLLCPWFRFMKRRNQFILTRCQFHNQSYVHMYSHTKLGLFSLDLYSHIIKNVLVKSSVLLQSHSCHLCHIHGHLKRRLLVLWKLAGSLNVCFLLLQLHLQPSNAKLIYVKKLHLGFEGNVGFLLDKFLNTRKNTVFSTFQS